MYYQFPLSNETVNQWIIQRLLKEFVWIRNRCITNKNVCHSQHTSTKFDDRIINRHSRGWDQHGPIFRLLDDELLFLKYV